MAIKPFDLFLCLQEDLWSQNLPCEGKMWPGISLKQAAAVSIANSFLKKLRSGRTKETDELALEKFLHCNQRCENWLPPEFSNSGQEEIIGTVKQCLDSFWYRRGHRLVDSDIDVLEEAHFGAGSNIDARGESFYAKLFSSPLSMSDLSLYRWYRRDVAKFPDWEDAEANRLLQFGNSEPRSSNRLTFVPKNDQISRTICVEPTLNTYFQLGFASILERRLCERFGISLQTQPDKNRELARLGSLTGSLSTIDLESASDSISLSMLRYLLPPDFLFWLERYRSRDCEVKGRGTLSLKMVSSMGNGYTFPLQTIIFASVVTACYAVKGVSRTDYPWGVFGDDIICASSVTRNVIDTLTFLGFKVNSDKTFTEGPFRESCGADFFNGVNIRGVYVKSLDTPEARYSVVNQLTRFSARTGIFLPRTVGRLLETVDFLPVPPWEDFSGGIHVPVSLSRDLATDRDTGGKFYHVRVPRVSKIRFEDNRVKVPKRSKPLHYNPEGLMVSLLQGSVRSMSMGLRENGDTRRYATERRVTSSWSYTPVSNSPLIERMLDWRRWDSAVIGYIER
jgi:hypothetical protein